MKRKEFIKALCVFALFDMLNAYDFNATNFQLTTLPQPKPSTIPPPSNYYLYQQNQENLGVGFQFKGDNVYEYKKDGALLENSNIWIIGAGAVGMTRRVFLDFSSNTQSFDSIGLNLRDGTANQSNEYVLLNLQYEDSSGQIARGVYYNPANPYGQVLYNILGITLPGATPPANSIQECTAPNSCPQVANNSTMIFRGVDVNDDMLQPYFSNDVLFGNALDSENFGVRVNSAVFKGNTIDFSGVYYDNNGQPATTPVVPNANTQALVFNGANAIEKNQIEFKIGRGTTNISLYDLGAKSLNFSNLQTTSILNLESRASSIAGNLHYNNTNSKLNLIFASPTTSQNITLTPLATHSTTTTNTTQSLSSIFADSAYLGGVNGASGIIGINDSAQVTFIGANSHRFSTTTDSFQFIGDTTTDTSTTNNVLFLNAGTLNGDIFTTKNENNGNSKINFTLFGTSVNNLKISDSSDAGNTTTNHNTLNVVFNAQSSAQSVQSGANTWDSLNSNLAPYFQSLNLENSKLTGSATLGENVRAKLIFLGALSHNFSNTNILKGGSKDSIVGINNITTSGTAGALNFDSIKDFNGQALVINSNLSATSITDKKLARYTHIFNGLGSNLSTALSQKGQNAANEILGNFNNDSGGLTNWSVSDLSAQTSFEGTLSAGIGTSNFVFLGANALGTNANLSAADENYTYTFVDFGAFDLDNITDKEKVYGKAIIALAGNSYVRNNIGVAFSGTLDVSFANRFQARGFFGNHIYGENKKDVVLDFGGDERGANYSNFHNGFIVEGTKDSIYAFNNIGSTLDFSGSVNSQTKYEAEFDSNGDGKNDKAIKLTKVSNIQKYLIGRGINFYVDSTKYGINGNMGEGAGATIGFKDVSIKGALNDDDFNIEAVFNTTSHLRERNLIDTSGKRVSVIESGAPSRTSSFSGTIGGDSRKRIAFIGSGSFDDNLLISGGTSDSVYSFYSVGNLGQEAIDKIINAGNAGNSATPPSLTSLGSFNFDGSTSILANISKTLTAGTDGTISANESISLGVNSANSTLSEFTQGVYMQGALGGNITKNALFASGSSVVIREGNSASTYDFSLSNNGLIAVKLDFADSLRVDTANNTITQELLHGTINGLNGFTSIIGTFENSVIGTDSISANQISFSGNLQGSGGQWFVPESSKIDSLRLSNDEMLITNGSTRGATLGNALAIVDLSSYNWLGCKRDTGNCVAPEEDDSYDYYEVIARPLGAGFEKKTLTIAPSTIANTAGTTNAYNSLFDSKNGVFRLGLNLTQSPNNAADEIKVILTTNGLNGTTYLQLIQDASTASDYQYTTGEKIYAASVVDSTNSHTISDDAFRATEQYMGLGVFRTELKFENKELANSDFGNDPSLVAAGTAHNGKRWYIDSVTIESIDDGLLEREVFTPLEGAVLSPYFSLYAETNNMAKRLGEVRAGNDSSGMWAKVIKGGIEGQNGYYGHNFGLQGGFDKVTQYQGTKVYLGLVGSFTSSWGSGAGSSLNARSDSFAIGFYRSALFADLSYLDIVGKYIYSRNEYTASSLSFAGRDTVGVNSGYVSAEYGRRFGLRGMPGFYFQPQAEVILGYIGAQNLTFRSVGSTLFVDSKANFVTIGRVGADMLNAFRINNIRGIWRVGGSLVKDFGARGEMIVRDEIAKTADRSKTIDSDFRVVFSFGFDMRLSQNSRIYLELDKSFFGTYNMDYVMSAGVRYSFGPTPQRRGVMQPNFYDTQYIQYPSQQYLP